jgi:hypothetical protein
MILGQKEEMREERGSGGRERREGDYGADFWAKI